MHKTQAEALAKIQVAAQEALDKIKSVMGQRHYVAGMSYDGGEDLYLLLLQAESCLLSLQGQSQRIQELYSQAQEGAG